jgi:hypothetical protein
MTSTLERRLEALEAASGGDGGCGRCRGLLTIVCRVITGEFHSATWNGEEVSEENVRERRTEVRCPQCGRKLGPDEAPVIKVGGLSLHKST